MKSSGYENANEGTVPPPPGRSGPHSIDWLSSGGRKLLLELTSIPRAVPLGGQTLPAPVAGNPHHALKFRQPACKCAGLSDWKSVHGPARQPGIGAPQGLDHAGHDPLARRRRDLALLLVQAKIAGQQVQQLRGGAAARRGEGKIRATAAAVR